MTARAPQKTISAITARSRRASSGARSRCQPPWPRHALAAFFAASTACSPQRARRAPSAMAAKSSDCIPRRTATRGIASGAVAGVPPADAAGAEHRDSPARRAPTRSRAAPSRAAATRCEPPHRADPRGCASTRRTRGARPAASSSCRNGCVSEWLPISMPAADHLAELRPGDVARRPDQRRHDEEGGAHARARVSAGNASV